MALTDLRKGILDEARQKAGLVDDEASREAKEITDQARKAAKEILAQAKLHAASASEMAVQQSESDAHAEAQMILSEAKEGIVESEMNSFSKKVANELAASHMKELLKLALSRFSEVADMKDTVVEISKAYAPLVKGASKVIPSGEKGKLVLWTTDKRVVLDCSASSIVQANLQVVKSELSKAMGV